MSRLLDAVVDAATATARTRHGHRETEDDQPENDVEDEDDVLEAVEARRWGVPVVREADRPAERVQADRRGAARCRPRRYVASSTTASAVKTTHATTTICGVIGVSGFLAYWSKRRTLSA